MQPIQAVAALSALGQETRLALFRLLVERGPDGLPAGTIAERLGIPPSSLTFHLQHLHRARLITQRRLHRQLIYAADYAAMNGLVLYLTDNCCGRGTTAPACSPACAPTCATPDAAPSLPRNAAA
jgi:ArsR family transcriptional regulator, arsenate/arsenite/antimonite-responsive transcriptional repressor